jgi:hypothetical protein
MRPREPIIAIADEFAMNFEGTCAFSQSFYELANLAESHDGMDEAQGYIEEFVRETGWRPDKMGLFAGALLHKPYGEPADGSRVLLTRDGWSTITGGSTCLIVAVGGIPR